MDFVFLSIEQLNVRLFGQEILQDIQMELKKGEQWLIFGEAGSGKTALARTLAGNLVYKGRIHFFGFDDKDEIKRPGVLVVDQQHRFLNRQNQSNFYYQQRYNAIDAEATVTVSDTLAMLEDFQNNSLSKKALIDIFELTQVLGEPLIQLSNGENKRLQILIAVLRKPFLLILDEPFTGLDPVGRQNLENILTVLSESGQQFLLLTSRHFVPSCFTRFGRLQNGRLTVLNHSYEIQNKHSTAVIPPVSEFPSSLHFHYPEFNDAIRMRNVQIVYEGKKILDGINWEIKRGACWGLTGHNGAGKSTLLSLITADNPQAYANEIYLFDRKRGTGESIWEIKQKIGYLSPELQLYFDPAATAFSAMASGLFDTIGLFRKLQTDQVEYVREWLRFIDCLPFANRLLNSLPAGIQRMILLGRAMIKIPPLLVLDEPCQGLDGNQTLITLQMIDRFCRQYGASLIFVSHYQQEFPSCIDHFIHLEKGRMV